MSGADGRYYRLTAVPLGKFDGKMSGVEIITDVTEQRRAEEAFRQSQRRYAGLVNNLNIGVYRNTPGPHGRFLEANPAIVSMFEAKSKQDFLRRKVSDLYQDRSKRKQFSEKMMRYSFVKNEELKFKTLKGRKFWGSVTSVRKEDRHGNVYFDGIVEDITEIIGLRTLSNLSSLTLHFNQISEIKGLDSLINLKELVLILPF